MVRRFHYNRLVIMMAAVAVQWSLVPADMDLRLVRPAIIGSKEVVPCPEDYSPCVCGDYPGVGLYVVCDTVTIEELRDVLNRTTYETIFWLQVMPKPLMDGIVSIPADVLSEKKIQAIDFYCSSPLYRLEIDPAAFRSSLQSTEHFYIFGCDLEQQTEFKFLEGFDRLVHLHLYGSANIGGLAQLPRLPQLAELDIQRCSGLAELPARSLPNLRRLDLSDNALDDEQVGRILGTLAGSTLQALSLAYNQLTLVPSSLSSFVQLSDLSLSGNRIRSVHGSQLKLSAPKIEQLLLANISLSSIDPGALEGNIVHVDLSRNNLSHFDRDVFEALLRRIQFNSGSLLIESNPLNCCTLEWLVGSDLMPFVIGGECADGTRIDQLGSDGFEECPASDSTPFVHLR